MMKNYFSLLLALLMSMVSTTALAYHAEIDGIYYNFSRTTAQVTYKSADYNSYSGDVVIPESVDYNGITYIVVEIGRGAFWGSTGLTSVSIPNGVTKIDYLAFGGCTGLTSITIPNSVTTLADKAFASCI